MRIFKTNNSISNYHFPLEVLGRGKLKATVNQMVINLHIKKIILVLNLLLHGRYPAQEY